MRFPEWVKRASAKAGAVLMGRPKPSEEELSRPANGTDYLSGTEAGSTTPPVIISATRVRTYREEASHDLSEFLAGRKGLYVASHRGGMLIFRSYAHLRSSRVRPLEYWEGNTMRWHWQEYPSPDHFWIPYSVAIGRRPLDEDRVPPAKRENIKIFTLFLVAALAESVRENSFYALAD